MLNGPSYVYCVGIGLGVHNRCVLIVYDQLGQYLVLDVLFPNRLQSIILLALVCYAPPSLSRVRLTAPYPEAGCRPCDLGHEF